MCVRATLEAAGAARSPNAVALVELICENPVVTTRSIERRLGVSRPTALRLLKRMEEQGVLSEGSRERAVRSGTWRGR